jgi:hypothetical protein
MRKRQFGVKFGGNFLNLIRILPPWRIVLGKLLIESSAHNLCEQTEALEMRRLDRIEIQG